MGILAKLLGAEKRNRETRREGERERRGLLVHIFVFDSGPSAEDESKYVNSIVRSLLPEAMAYASVPVSFFKDEKMPFIIGQNGPPDLDRATSYPFAWMKIQQANPSLVDGLKVGRERFTFGCEEYSSELGNRGILFAFYDLPDSH